MQPIQKLLLGLSVALSVSSPVFAAEKVLLQDEIKEQPAQLNIETVNKTLASSLAKAISDKKNIKALNLKVGPETNLDAGVLNFGLGVTLATTPWLQSTTELDTRFNITAFPYLGEGSREELSSEYTKLTIKGSLEVKSEDSLALFRYMGSLMLRDIKGTAANVDEKIKKVEKIAQDLSLAKSLKELSISLNALKTMLSEEAELNSADFTTEGLDIVKNLKINEVTDGDLLKYIEMKYEVSKNFEDTEATDDLSVVLRVGQKSIMLEVLSTHTLFTDEVGLNKVTIKEVLSDVQKAKPEALLGVESTLLSIIGAIEALPASPIDSSK